MAINIIHTRNLFLKSLCCLYMFAFASLFVQIPGLYGQKGLLPAHVQFNEFESITQCLSQRKTLLCGANFLGLNMSYTMELLCLLGVSFSFIGFVWSKFCSSLFFFALWALYLSLWQVGQTFLWFQWDILLLEVGFLAIFVAPLTFLSFIEFKPRNLITMWLLRWALFRLMFASGVVKLQSGCPTWWGLTALDIHYESQCIPTPLAWFAHHLPSWWQKLCVIGVYVIEIPITFFFFSPIRSHKIFSFYAQIFLQLSIILTGNYNFFNLLTIVMCLSLIDDAHLGYRSVEKGSSSIVYLLKTYAAMIFKWLGYGLLFYYTLAYFEIRFSPSGTVLSSTGFSRDEFDNFLSKAVPLSVAIGALSLLFTIAEALTTCIFEIRGSLNKAFAFSSTLVYAVAAIALFGISLTPYTVLHLPSNRNIWPVFKRLHADTKDLQLSSSYGLFRHMTGVGGRPEVILEGANDLQGPWLEYEFPYKPGSLNRMPPIVAPHQPRLDWQMWFAALGTYNQHPWLVSFSFRLLQGNKDAIAFLDSSSPWRKKPPKYIRGIKYLYHYTSFNDTSGNWWRRTNREEYMPTYSVDHKPLIDYLKKLQLVGQKDVEAKNLPLTFILDQARIPFTLMPTEYLLNALFITALIIIWTKNSERCHF